MMKKIASGIALVAMLNSGLASAADISGTVENVWMGGSQDAFSCWIAVNGRTKENQRFLAVKNRMEICRFATAAFYMGVEVTVGYTSSNDVTNINFANKGGRWQ